MKKLLVISFIILGFSRIGFAQDPFNSVYTVPAGEKMYKNTVWREMNLGEKINTPFWSKDREISRLLIEAVRAGLIQAYKPDPQLPVTSHDDDENLVGLERMSKEEFLEKLTIKADNAGGDPFAQPAGGDPDPFAQPAGGAEDPFAQFASTTDAGPEEVDPLKMTNLLLEEDIFFDQVRSRMYNEIKTMTVRYLTPAGIYEPLVTVDYREAEKYFRKNPDNAIWFNLQNSGQHRNMADAFLLKLYHAKIVKMSRNNPTGDQLIAMYGGNPELVLYKSQELEFKLAEYESDLWEY